MGFFYCSAFLLLCAAVFVWFQVSPLALFSDIAHGIRHIRERRKVSMKQKIRQSVRKKRVLGIQKIFLDAKNVLVLTHRTDRMYRYSTASVILFFAGVLISVSLDNYFLLPVLSVGMAMLPWLYILLNAVSFQHSLDEELETTLSMITTSYLRSDNIIGAVTESIDNIHYPIREIFEKFIIQANMISPDIPALLKEMKNSLDNTVFHEWVDQLILCMQNRTLKSTLQPIVSRLATVREVTGKLDTIMYEPVKQFIEMAALLILNFPLLRWMYPDWYYTLMYHTVGQIIVALTFVVIFASLSAVIEKTRPVEYRR